MAPAAGSQRGSLRRLSGAGGSPGHWGSLVVVVRRPPAARPARSIAYAAIAYFLGNCCAFGQLRLLPTFCAIAAHFLGNSGLLVASGAHGGWWAAGTSGQVGGSLRNPGWQGGSGGSGGRGYRRTGGGSGSGGGVPLGRCRVPLGRCRVPLGRLGPLRGAAGRRGPPWAAAGCRGRFGVEWGGPCVTQSVINPAPSPPAAA